ncbi:MAG TPA: 16S rRNA (guanine(527)-N(7))-methyltransferase RsmG, partial [Alphaproteobacteria bacterium]|nr:16S rRNA (guanine(527)-N(7))-methyltransferase RsmG [Alphaproteobacteria bacterium]
MTPSEFAAATDVSRETLVRLEALHDLLLKWQARINLIGPATRGDIWRRHFFDTAQLLPLLPASSAGNAPLVLVDLGSGAGFPGLVMALMARGENRPLASNLVESDQRKAAFLIEAVRILELGDSVTIHNRRAESLNGTLRAQVDVVTARALADLSQLLSWSAPLLRSNGICLFLKGTTVSDELTLAHKVWKMHAEILPSRSDPSGVVLRLRDISRCQTP